MNSTKKIAVLAGDGIGPEVMPEAIKVLKAVSNDFEFTEALVGGAAYDKYESHLPKETIEIAKNSDAILFGSVGGPVNAQDHPKWRNAERNSILGLRKLFQLTINVRPTIVWEALAEISIPKKPLNFIIIRELAEGVYFGTHERVLKENGKIMARDIMEYNEETIEYAVKFAFNMAQKRRRKLTSIDKANVLECSKLWRETVDRLAGKYALADHEHMYVDNAAMQIVKNPDHFDVIVTSNLFGDILSDLASVLPGSLGLQGSASFNRDGFGLYEPAGGSAPDIAGQGIANPIGMIMSAALMLKYSFQMDQESDKILLAISQVLANYRTGDIAEEGKQTLTTSQMGDKIVGLINNM